MSRFHKIDNGDLPKASSKDEKELKVYEAEVKKEDPKVELQKKVLAGGSVCGICGVNAAESGGLHLKEAEAKDHFVVVCGKHSDEDKPLLFVKEDKEVPSGYVEIQAKDVK
jgi:formate dehydrogenase assembly factor FdhD